MSAFVRLAEVTHGRARRLALMRIGEYLDQNFSDDRLKAIPDALGQLRSSAGTESFPRTTSSLRTVLWDLRRRSLNPRRACYWPATSSFERAPQWNGFW